MRAASIFAVLIGLLLVPASLSLSAVERTQRAAALDNALRGKAQDEAQALDSYFARARSIDLLTAHNPGFVDFYKTGGRAGNGWRHRDALRNAVGALNYLEKLYAASIGEACFIDRTGPENARVVRGTTATTKDLSPDESGNPFFHPTFELRAGQVYQAAPYVSPDTHEWVISNSTPLPMADGSKPAIVHFEVTIESFRRQAASLAAGYAMHVVDARTGHVVLDARHRQRVGAPLGVPSDSRFTPLSRRNGRGGLVTLGHSRVAYYSLRSTPGNVNRWYAVASAHAIGGPLLTALDGRSIVAFVLALVLVGGGLLMLRSARRELTRAALTDPLTRLANRRQLMADLERAIPRADDAAPVVVAIFDLNGFKSYNDTFGHPAGDALLVRLAGSLRSAVAGRATCYRLGGDEFCILARGGAAERESIVAIAAEALSEHGAGFSIGAAYGAAVIPPDVGDPSDALRIADQRMYEQKRAGRQTAGQQSAAVLVKALEEREPDLGAHVGGVAQLVELVAAELGIPGDEVVRIRRAAELHDIGKVAIPDAIINKPAPLNEDEWALIKGHTLIGERILAAAPDLSDVATLVRSTHERVDGRGYPDGLAGDDIPLGARIVMVCDAYDALVSDRPYRPGRDHEAAIAELRRCSGTQFDPLVVDAFCRVAERAAARA